MKKVRYLLIAVFGLALITGCKSDGKAGPVNPPVAPNPPPVVPPPPPPPPPPPVNRAPAANAGADLNASTGQSIVLDASASSDPDGDTLRYAWTILSGPAGGATLTLADQAHAGFLATSSGTYVVQVSVQDPSNTVATDTLSIAVGPSRSATGITLEGLPTQLAQGSTATVAVYLPAPAGAGGANVALQNSDPTVADVPATITVPEGESVAAFTVEALAPGNVSFTATSAGVDAATASSTVSAATLAITTNQDGVAVGQAATLTVTLTAPAPAGGTRVALTLSDATRATLNAAQLDIAEGAASATATVTGTAAGAVTVNASIAGSLPARQRLMVIPAGASATQSSAALIDSALTAGTITQEQAVVYGIYAAFGSDALPALYRGNSIGRLDSQAARLATLKIESLSPASQEAIGKYLTPPIYSGSWGQNIAAKATRAKATRGVRTQAASVSCFERLRGMPTTDTLPNWKFIHTASFKIWYPTALSPDVAEFNWYTSAENLAAALNVAASIQSDYDKLRAILGDPLSDGTEPCGGGDAAIDIYVTRVGLGEKAQVMPYLPGECARPGWMWVAPDAIQDARVARNIIAHELVHLFQLRYARPDCGEWRFNILDEATASWAWDHLHPTDNYEHGFLTVDGGYFDPDAGEWRASILETGGSGVRNCNGYCDYAFFEWLDRKYGSQAIRGVLDATASANAQQAIERGLAGTGGGLEQLWPKFALAQYNDYQNHIHDEFKTWEGVSAASIRTAYIQGASHFITANISSGHTRELGDDVFSQLRSLRDGELPPMTTNFLSIRFDTKVTTVHFEHMSDLLKGQWPRLKVQALLKINGTWKPEEDWSSKHEVNYCREKRDERIEELVLIYSNSLAGDQPFLHEGPTVVRLYTQDEVMPKLTISNVSCMPWQGTTSVKQTNALGGFNKVTASVTYKRFNDPDIPDDEEEADPAQAFVVDHGTVSVEMNWLDESGCRQITTLTSGPINEIDSRLGVNTVTGFASGVGISTVDGATHILECPGSDPITATGPAPAQWLTMQSGEVGPDGRTLVGSKTETNPVSGVTTVSDWSLSSKPEE